MRQRGGIERLTTRVHVGWLDRFPGTVGIKQTAVVRGWNLDSFAAPPDDAMKEGLHQFLALSLHDPANDLHPVVQAAFVRQIEH